jgi:hypothetical protein
MGMVKEHYNAKPMAANATQNIGVAIAGFLPTVGGTLTVTDADGTVLVNAVPVTAGIYLKLRILLPLNTSAGGKVTACGRRRGHFILRKGHKKENDR